MTTNLHHILSDIETVSLKFVFLKKKEHAYRFFLHVKSHVIRFIFLSIFEKETSLGFAKYNYVYDAKDFILHMGIQNLY